MKVEVFASMGIISMFLMTLAMMKLVNQLEVLHTEQSEKEISVVFDLNRSMTTISIAFSPFTMFKVPIKGLEVNALSFFVFFQLHHAIPYQIWC